MSAPNIPARPLYDVRAMNADCSTMNSDKTRCYRSERRAHRYAQRLRREGYPVKVVVYTPKPAPKFLSR